ncbi:hypothetical protein AX774_g4077, partial [Zancudomyces culisetae]
FEKDTENSQDWHPGSDQQVLDLVHPSLYPVINGVSRAVTKDLSPTDTSIMESYMNLGAGSVDNLAFEAIKNNRKRTWYDSSVSEKFVWLPTEVDVNAERNTKILSYINNLHPKKYGKLYTCIEQVLGHFVPMFNKVLTYSTEKYVSKQTPRIDPTTYYVEYFDEFVARIKKEINTEDKRQKDGEEVENEEEGEEEEYEYEEEYYWEIFREQKLVTSPAEYSFSPQNIIEPVDIVDLNGTRLQVIVKMANICLTPEKPTYKGGVWHIEGMLNEDIVSTGIYYYHQENITESRLNFRKTVVEPDYEQGDVKGVRLMYGLEDEEALNQFLGGVTTHEGRCLSFPNRYQHQVQPFELVDKTKPGVRKILCFFLVNPNNRVYSTAVVPPQQKEWYAEELNKNPSKLTNLPSLVLDNINKHMNWPIERKDAEKYREELMKERKYLLNSQNELVFEREFSLCEH